MKHIPLILISVGICFLSLGLIIFFFTYYQIVGNELSYIFFRPNPNAKVALRSQHPTKNDIVPVDSSFGIVIPKINANSKIIPGVDPFDPAKYQIALTKGVAQAKGSSLPYENGSMFLFSHSSVNFYEALKYNSIFYMLDKLEKKDTIYIFYKDLKYTYTVTGKEIVDPSAISFLSNKTPNSLTLMTCWPPGTTMKRLFVTAKLNN